MFTGIITELGIITDTTVTPEGVWFTIQAVHTTASLCKGDSVAINGACHTAVVIENDSFRVVSMLETLEHTTMGSLRAGDTVNLERPLTADDTLDGHMVMGHIDGIGTERDIATEPSQTVMTIGVDEQHMRYIVQRGSIAIHGTSLTVTKTGRDWFTVSIIPHTRTHTTLGSLTIGALVNIEVDQAAKYAEKRAPLIKHVTSTQILDTRTASVVTGSTDGTGLRIAIILPVFNDTIGSQVLHDTLHTLRAQSVREDDITIVRVPGAFEIPVTARALIRKHRFDAIIALGVVIRGETSHYDQICTTLAHHISEISASTGVPIIHGVLTVDNTAQAMARIDGTVARKGYDSAHAAIQMAHVLRLLTAPERITAIKSCSPSHAR